VPGLPQEGDQRVGAVEVLDLPGLGDLKDQPSAQVPGVAHQTEYLLQKAVDHQGVGAEIGGDPRGSGLGLKLPDNAADHGKIEGLDHVQILGQLDRLRGTGVR